MTPWSFILRSGRFHWRMHLAALLATVVATAVLVGALAVNDCLKFTLAQRTDWRLGQVHLAMAPADRFFRSALAGDLAAAMGRDPVNSSRATAAAILLDGTASAGDGSTRAGHVNVLGVDDSSWAMIGGQGPLRLGPKEVIVNEPLAGQLGVRAGQEIVLRIAKPSALGRDIALASDRSEDSSAAVRLTVSRIAPDSAGGAFSLHGGALPARNAFVSLAALQPLISRRDQANLLLIGGSPGGDELASARSALAKTWQLADAELQLRPVPSGGVELISQRVFLDGIVANTVTDSRAIGILTYFVNEIRHGDKATPYSIVTAIGPLNRQTRRVSSASTTAASSPAAPPPAAASWWPADLPMNLADDEIVINDWLADDLGIAAGQTNAAARGTNPAAQSIDLEYFVLGPMRQLDVAADSFKLRSVAPLTGAMADASLMPEFPGLADVDNCRDWRPGIPIDLKAIRKKDEQYWNEHRGTPKAFISLSTGQRLWANHYGKLTAIRMPPGVASEESLRAAIDPAALGLVFQPVRQMAAAQPATDFGQLFLGFSLFLIVSALLLLGLLLALGVDHRRGEVGTLMALGFSAPVVRRLLMAESLAPVVLGTVAGCLASIAYTKAMLWALAMLWPAAGGSMVLAFHVAPITLAAGTAAGLFLAAATAWLVLRKLACQGPHQLLTQTYAPARPIMRRVGAWIPAGLTVVAGAIVIAAMVRGGRDAAGLFFAAGFAVLLASVLACRRLLETIAAFGGAASTRRLVLAGLSRRPGRSLSTIALLACGTFVVVAVAAFHIGEPSDVADRAGGTGGFSLIAQSSMPIYRDLSTPPGRAAMKLADGPLDKTSIVSLSLHPAEQADCLNPARPREPQLLGVEPRQLADRGSFHFTSVASGLDRRAGWRLLEAGNDDAIPAIGDEATVTWSLGKNVGDTIDYTTDRGQAVKLRIVGTIANSILQGSLLIAKHNFDRVASSDAGYRLFLIDCPVDAAPGVSQLLTQRLADRGIEVSIAADRLAAFAAVENAYMSLFQLLGGWGLILGSVGLGLIVLRNILERQSELALLRAVGFSRRQIRSLVLREHWLLLGMGIACGTASALLAILPALLHAAGDVPVASLAATLLTVLLGGGLWVVLAVYIALRRPMLAALRSE